MSQEALAKLAGVKYQSVQEWEREDGTAPSRKRLSKVASALGVSISQLLSGDDGSAPAVHQSRAGYANDSPEITRLIKAFAWLMDGEKAVLLRDIEAKAGANKAIAKEMGPRFTLKTDQEMLEHLKRSGDFPPGAKKRVKRRGTTFKEEDPE